MAVTYDPGADIVEVWIREGKIENTLSGRGEFVIYIDERGAFWIVMIVYEWDKNPDVEELKKLGVEVLEGRPVRFEEAVRLLRSASE